MFNQLQPRSSLVEAAVQAPTLVRYSKGFDRFALFVSERFNFDVLLVRDSETLDALLVQYMQHVEATYLGTHYIIIVRMPRRGLFGGSGNTCVSVFRLLVEL